MTDKSEPKIQTAAAARKDRQLSMMCGSEGPPLDGKAGPRCQRPRGHDGPHRTIRGSDFAVTAEWFADRYFVKPSERKR